jgi:AAA domain
MTIEYDRLEQESNAKSKLIHDFTARWEKLEPVAAVNGSLSTAIERFAQEKGISIAALTALDTRIRVHGKGPSVDLAWGYPTFVGGRRQVTAIKYRDIANDARTAEPGSVFVQPLIVGNAGTMDWFVGEGETDSARLYDLVGDVARILCLPAGAKTFKRGWADWLPRGATIYLAHDADEAGDEGAEKAARIIGSGTVRVRPPAGDWCDWQGDRAGFIGLVQEARKVSAVSPLGGEPWAVFRDSATGDMPYLIEGVWPEGAVAFIGAEPKAGKTWLAVAVAVSLVTARPLFGLHAVTKPRPVVYVALEGHRAAIRARIGCLSRGLGIDPEGTDLDGLHMIYKPRGFNLSDPDWARWLCEYVVETGARLVLVDTLRSATTIRESNEGAGDMAKLLKLLSPITSDHVSVGFLHHFTKLNEQRQQRAAADRMTGTGALRGHMDFGLFITKADFIERRMRVELEVRDGVALEPFGVKITGIGTGTYGGFTYTDTAKLELDDEVLGEQQVKAPAGEITAWIREQPYGRATTREICDQFDISRDTLSSRRNLICANSITYYDAGRFSNHQVTDSAGDMADETAE